MATYHIKVIEQWMQKHDTLHHALHWHMVFWVLMPLLLQANFKKWMLNGLME